MIKIKATSIKNYSLCFLILFTFLALGFGCSPSDKNKKYISELKTLLPDSATKYFQPDSIELEIFDHNNYSLQYSISYAGLNFDTTSQAQFIYLPFFISDRPINILSSLKIDTSEVNLLEVIANSSVHYYLLAVSKNHLSDSGTLRCNYMFSLPSAEVPNLKIPITNSEKDCRLIVKTSREKKLTDNVITSGSAATTSLNQYPEELQLPKRTYTISYQPGAWDVIMLNTYLTRIDYHMRWQKIIWCLCILALIIWVLAYWKSYTQFSYKRLSEAINDYEEDLGSIRKETPPQYQLETANFISYLKNEFKMYRYRKNANLVKYIIAIILTLLCTLLFSVALAQKVKRFAIQDFNMEIQPVFVAKDSLDMNIKMKYLLLSSGKLKTDNPISIFIDCKNCLVQESEILTVPSWLKKELVPQIGGGYELRLFPGNDNPVEDYLFEYIVNHRSGYAEVKEAEKQSFGRNLSEVRICAHQFDFIDTSHNKQFLFIRNDYPWDKMHFNCSVRMGNTTIIKQVRVKQPISYVINNVNFYSNGTTVSFDNASADFEVKTNAGNYIKPNIVTSTRVTMSRGVFQQWIWWIVFILLCAFVPKFLATPKTHPWRFICAIAALVGINIQFFLGLIQKEYAVSISYLISFCEFSWGKLFFWIGIAVLLVSLLVHLKKGAANAV